MLTSDTRRRKSRQNCPWVGVIQTALRQSCGRNRTVVCFRGGSLVRVRQAHHRRNRGRAVDCFGCRGERGLARLRASVEPELDRRQNGGRAECAGSPSARAGDARPRDPESKTPRTLGSVLLAQVPQDERSLLLVIRFHADVPSSAPRSRKPRSLHRFWLGGVQRHLGEWRDPAGAAEAVIPGSA